MGRQALAGALGAATLGLAALALLAPRRRRMPALPRCAPDRPQAGGDPAVRALHASAALLAVSVLADSAVEHYRGSFHNPGMFAPLLTAALTLATAGRAACGRPVGWHAYAGAVATGCAGTLFHLYDLQRRPGGFGWANLFYAAPLGAPAALGLSGLLGLAARHVQAGATTLAGLPAGRVLCAIAATGLAGSSAEAALLHFRGAYHNPAMWLPVTVPPVGAALLGAAALTAPHRGHGNAPRRFTRAWLVLTGVLGAAGSAFHARGIARRMGGWRNWSQNLLDGPPLPAPPAFSALALAGCGALELRERTAGPARERA